MERDLGSAVSGDNLSGVSQSSRGPVPSLTICQARIGVDERRLDLERSCAVQTVPMDDVAYLKAS